MCSYCDVLPMYVCLLLTIKYCARLEAFTFIKYLSHVKTFKSFKPKKRSKPILGSFTISCTIHTFMHCMLRLCHITRPDNICRQAKILVSPLYSIKLLSVLRKHLVIGNSVFLYFSLVTINRQTSYDSGTLR